MSETTTTNSMFDVSSAKFKDIARIATDWITSYVENIDSYPVVSTAKPGEIMAQLPQHPPEQAENFETIFSDFEKIIIPGITHWNHPRFFAYFSITGSFTGIIGEMLSAALNVNAMLWKTSPSATELETVVLDWLRQMVDLPQEFEGVINDTASVGSLCALAAAREYAGLHIRRKGMAGRTDLPLLTIYTSEQAHSSIEKGAIILGLGQDFIRKIPTNARFEMDDNILEKRVSQDLAAGIKPVAVVATIGTTSTTSIDPIKAIAAICRKYNLWLHVDAAYGGAAAVLPEIRAQFSDWQSADSIIVNPHKWLFTPIDCSVLFCRRPAELKQAFSLVPEYLKTAEGEKVKNYMDYGVALGRRFRALKLWMVIRSLGTKKIQQIIRRHISFAQQLAELIKTHPHFELLAPVAFSTVVFRFHPSSTNQTSLNQVNEKLLDRVNATGDVFLSHTKLNDTFAIRLAIGNIKTTWDDVTLAWKIIQQKATEV